MPKRWFQRQALALVLSGGGARGALQAGALRALIEEGIRPDFLVGTSIGAINAAFMGLRGWSLATVEALQETWRIAAASELLPARTVWLTMRTVFNLTGRERQNPIRAFLIAHGLRPEMRFDAMQMPVYVVVTDLHGGRTLVYGDDANERVLDAVEASAALPPWVLPIERGGMSLMDGGAVSNLPLEPAMARGATDIVALDLHDPRGLATDPSGLGGFLWKLTTTTQIRETEMELALAVARGVRVRHVRLVSAAQPYLWDFSQTDALMTDGYTITRRALADWQMNASPQRFSASARWRAWRQQMSWQQPGRRTRPSSRGR